MKSFPRETFGSRLRRYRHYRRFTQTKLAREVRSTQGFISKIENDQLEPGVYLATRLSILLRFPLKGLVEKP